MKFIVIGTPVCGYCLQAKKLLEDKGFNYEYRCLTEIANEEQQRLMKIADKEFRTVPQIFIIDDDLNDEWRYVGGYTELAELIL